MDFAHIPVMFEECLQGLNLKDGGIYFDGTIGGAGHSYGILKRTSPSGRLIATDLDDDAIAAASKRLDEFDGRFKIYKSDYKQFENVFSAAEIDLIDGAILDFGVSSWQLDNKDRGFSYMKQDAPLDMRMDAKQLLTAEKIINEYPQSEIAKILKVYGEEKFASNIAANIVRAREKGAITTCGELVNIIENSIPKKFQQNGPAARKSFQAIRIAVNGELNGLYDCVVNLTRRLKKGGRIVILTFHSLEDRIVKEAFKFLEKDCICDKNLPVCVCGKKKEIEIITKKPIVASDDEMKKNTRSKCAKLRIAEKII
ncbi:MAG: 16S rRNA (cytosine(1402)-N(4))-methyltransferase RsmH [Clostridia bacterium]|jgi:16S rRNA (cytosine1402-N4)-methyltransferase|nr:16S rRNA (cytosine(1402)-N(4))-methyltransferase RsmH [Clostridia bacterium]